MTFLHWELATYISDHDFWRMNSRVVLVNQFKTMKCVLVRKPKLKQIFGVIEYYTSKVESVFTPQQWYEHVKQAAVKIK